MLDREATHTAAPARHREAAVTSADRRVAAWMLAALGRPPIQIRLWSGETIRTSDAAPVATVATHLTISRGTIRQRTAAIVGTNTIQLRICSISLTRRFSARQ